LSLRRSARIPQWLIHVAALVPFLWLILSLLLKGGGANPIQYLEKRTGDYALVLLLVSLACTPLNLLTGSTRFTRFRRPLGLYAFAYATVHFLLFIGLDYAFFWKEIFNQFVQKTYLWFGLSALLILLVLALTSSQRSQERLKKNWRRLHTLIYLAAGLVVIHFSLSIKGNIFLLHGAVFWPLAAILTLLILYTFRFRIIQRAIKHLHQSLH
jgi:methionine sulfoxide reductase heme-binding subunit